MNPETRAGIAKRGSLASVALISALSLAACGDDVEDAEATQSSQSSQAATGDTSGGEVLTFEDVSDDLDSYVGETVTVRAAVDAVVTPEVFTTTRPDGTTLEPIVVVDAKATEELDPGSTVEVTGVVQEEFLIAETEETLGIQLDDEVLGEWENRPFIEATSVDASVSG